MMGADDRYPESNAQGVCPPTPPQGMQLQACLFLEEQRPCSPHAGLGCQGRQIFPSRFPSFSAFLPIHVGWCYAIRIFANKNEISHDGQKQRAECPCVALALAVWTAPACMELAP